MTPTTFAELLAYTGSMVITLSGSSFSQTSPYSEVGYHDTIISADFSAKTVGALSDESVITTTEINASRSYSAIDYSGETPSNPAIITFVADPDNFQFISLTIQFYNDTATASHATVTVNYDDGYAVGSGTAVQVEAVYTPPPISYITCSSTDPDVLDIYDKGILTMRLTSS